MITIIAKLKISRYYCCKTIQSVGRTSHCSFIVIETGFFDCLFWGIKNLKVIVRKTCAILRKLIASQFTWCSTALMVFATLLDKMGSKCCWCTIG